MVNWLVGSQCSSEVKLASQKLESDQDVEEFQYTVKGISPDQWQDGSSLNSFLVC